ncbi:hypothetical protein HU200_066463 [Digitaria exilis]|uniref:Uncharacterized protein n=1 Tax=Digitaria exilis TaxID=1010633 RepID=A0A835DTU2_9POAL|nr:hypothetical protein HU200_066463 [Digitaria exilis]
MARPHIVVVPAAARQCQLLHRHGAYVTFVNTEHNHRRVQETEGAGAMRGQQDFRFQVFPDGLLEPRIKERSQEHKTLNLVGNELPHVPPATNAMAAEGPPSPATLTRTYFEPLAPRHDLAKLMQITTFAAALVSSSSRLAAAAA